MDKRKITLSVIAVAALLVVLIGSTYAYWTLNDPAQSSDSTSSGYDK